MYNHHAKGTNTAGIPKYEHAKELMEIDGWKLVRSKYLKINSYPIHMKCKSGVWRTTSSEIHPKDGRCVKCEEKAPDEIMALWRLHNWEVATV